MKTFFYKILLLFFSALILVSCDDETATPVNPLAGLTKLSEGYALGTSAKVEVWGSKTFFMGYNKLTIVLLDSINPKDTIKDAHIYFLPVMTMGSGMMAMQHACPVENPAEEVENGVFKGAVAFVMPTSAEGTWKLGVKVHNHKNDKEGTANMDISVANPNTAVMSVFTATTSDASKLVLSLVEPVSPKVGMNDIEFTLHRKVSMMSWPADSTYTIEITPEMPSMGHGSPNNVNPAHTGNGHYTGKVNFTMTGEWKVNVVVKKDGTPVSSNTAFTITL